MTALTPEPVPPQHVHEIWCHGGPLDGTVVEKLSDTPAPEPLLQITVDGVTAPYARVPIMANQGDGIRWEYRYAPDDDDPPPPEQP